MCPLPSHQLSLSYWHLRLCCSHSKLICLPKQSEPVHPSYFHLCSVFVLSPHPSHHPHIPNISKFPSRFVICWPRLYLKAWSALVLLTKLLLNICCPLLQVHSPSSQFLSPAPALTLTPTHTHTHTHMPACTYINLCAYIHTGGQMFLVLPLLLFLSS